MRPITYIAVPYHCGRRDSGLARGPEVILGSRDATWIPEPQSEFEAKRIFEINALLSDAVSQVRRGGAFPLIVSGNCNACLGAIGGLGGGGVGIVWFDAHGDVNTPDTTRSGFFDGTPLATALGDCWQAMAAGIPGFTPVAESATAHVGGRDFDPAEIERLAASQVAVVDGPTLARDGVAAALQPALDRVAEACEAAYLHVDTDVLDPGVAPMNSWAAPGGLSLDELAEAIGMVGASLPLAAASVTAYDPDVDFDGAGRAAAQTILATVAEVGGGRR